MMGRLAVLLALAAICAAHSHGNEPCGLDRLRQGLKRHMTNGQEVAYKLHQRNVKAAGVEMETKSSRFDCSSWNVGAYTVDLSGLSNVTVDLGEGAKLSIDVCHDRPPMDNCAGGSGCAGYLVDTDGKCYCAGKLAKSTTASESGINLVSFTGGATWQKEPLTLTVGFLCSALEVAPDADTTGVEPGSAQALWQTVAVCRPPDRRFKLPSMDSPIGGQSCLVDPIFSGTAAECMSPEVTQNYMDVVNWPNTTLKLKVVSFSYNGSSLLNETDAELLVAKTNMLYADAHVKFEGSFHLIESEKYFSGALLSDDQEKFVEDFEAVADMIGAEHTMDERTHLYAVVGHLSDPASALKLLGVCAPTPGQNNLPFGAVCLLDSTRSSILSTTPAHEIGHSLGLLHPFQDTSAAVEGTDPYECEGDICVWVSSSDDCVNDPRPLLINLYNASAEPVEELEAYVYAELNHDGSQLTRLALCGSTDPDTCADLEDVPQCGASCQQLGIQSATGADLSVTLFCQTRPGVAFASNCTAGKACYLRTEGVGSCKYSPSHVISADDVPDDLNIKCGDECKAGGDGFMYTKYCGVVPEAGDGDVCITASLPEHCVPEKDDWVTGDYIADTEVQPIYFEIVDEFDAAKCELKDPKHPPDQCLGDHGTQSFTDLDKSSSLIMSYFPDNCQTRFSAGEIARMRCTIDRYYATQSARAIVDGTKRPSPPVSLLEACLVDDSTVRVEWVPPVNLLLNEGSLAQPRNLKFELTRVPAFAGKDDNTITLDGNVYLAVDQEAKAGDQYMITAIDDNGRGAYINNFVTATKNCTRDYTCKTSSCVFVKGTKITPGDNHNNDGGGGGMSPGTKAGIAIGVIAGVGILAVVFVVMRRRQQSAGNRFTLAPDRT